MSVKTVVRQVSLVYPLNMVAEQGRAVKSKCHGEVAGDDVGNRRTGWRIITTAEQIVAHLGVHRRTDRRHFSCTAESSDAIGGHASNEG